MVRSARLFASAIAVLAMQPLATPASALNLFSFVGEGGSNSNPCTTAALRCATFTGALAKTEPSGEIRCVGSLSSASNFVIDKPITIDCTGVPGLTAGLTGQVGITINISEATFPEGEVILRGFTIDGFPELTGNAGGSDGIRFIGGGGALYVENSRIFGFSQQGIEFAPTSSADIFVRDTIITNNAGGGVVIAPAAGSAIVRGSLSNVRINRNGGAGVAVNKSSGAAAVITVDDSLVEKNTNGLSVNGALARILLGGTTVAYNTLGLQLLNNGKILSAGDNNISLNSTDGAPSVILPPE